MKKAVALVIVCLVSLVMSIMLGSLFLRVKGAYEFSRVTKERIQAERIAEAGAYLGVAALRKEITKLSDNVASLDTSNFLPYVDSNITVKDSLDFFCNFLNFKYTTGRTDQIEKTVTQENFNSGINGVNYQTTIFIQKQKNSAGNDIQASTSGIGLFAFPYEFTMRATATVNGVRRTVKLTGGNFSVELRRGSFSRYALFTSIHRSPSGTVVWFTNNTKFYGPVHTNDRLSFAFNPGAYFSDAVTQSNKYARFYNQGWSRLRDDDHNGTRDVPTFNGGFTREVAQENLSDAVSKVEIKKNALGTLSEPSSNGVYVPFNTNGAGGGITGTVTGGIYVEGNAALALGVDGNGNAVYTIQRGSTATTVITVDRSASTTSVLEGGVTKVYSGLPEGTAKDGTIIYVDGEINGLSGLVQKDTEITITSKNDMKITGNVVYQQYDLDANSNPTADGYTNVLGLVSWDGDIVIGTTAPDDLKLHAVIMAPKGVFTVEDYSSGVQRGDVTLLGGVITDRYGPFGTFSYTGARTGYGRNFIYDRRMRQVSPPYFPERKGYSAASNELSKDVGNMGLVWQEEN